MPADEFLFDEQRDSYVAALRREHVAYVLNAALLDRAGEVRAELARLGEDVSAEEAAAGVSKPARGKARTEAETAETRGETSDE